MRCVSPRLGVVLFSTPLFGDSERPQAVSPGSTTVSQQLAGSCPAFSWGGVVEATGYELIIYRVAENGELQTVREVQLPRGATSWTPAASECPRSGSRYAWAVRSLEKRGAGQWSEALLFETAGAPTDADVRHAMQVLRQYRESQDREPASGISGPDQAAVAGDGERSTRSSEGKAGRLRLRERVGAVEPACSNCHVE
jgi:hypothetical protein